MKKKIGLILVILVIIAGVFFFLGFDGKIKNPIPSEEKKSPAELIPSLVVPHFEGATDRRKELVDKISQKITPKNIVLVSVNHFNVGEGDIIVADKEWDFKESKPKINRDLIDKLTADGFVKKDNEAFLNEHGIKNVLPDLANRFPKAEFMPLIIKEKTSKEDIDKLGELIYISCPDCLLVASIDFSHYCPSSLAQIHDELALDALSNQNPEKGWEAETDSPQTMRLLVSWSKKFPDTKFNLFEHTSSADKSGNEDAEATSYILGFYSNQEKTPSFEKKTTFVLAGDMMFDRNVYHNFKDKGLEHIFDSLPPRVFWGVDLAMANLEGPISQTEINDDYASGSMVFNFPPQTLEVLKLLRLNAVSLANNHTLNAGQKGLAYTRDLLGKSDIKAIGGQSDFNDFSLIRFETKIPLSVITVNLLEDPGEGAINTKIKEEKAAGRYVFVFPHWGNEYQSKHSATQKKQAQSYIDSGADAIIGSHPHVVQDFEVYKGKPIVYSLGNFVFDQFFSDETQQGLMVAGEITDKEIKLSFFPTEEHKVTVDLVEGAEKDKRINQVFDINSNEGFEKISRDTIKIAR